MSQNNAPLIWMNVTTSANWNRPPVGIVRVEQALCTELEALYGRQRFRKCIWREGQFIEWAEPIGERPSEIDDAIDMMLPKTESFDLSRRFMYRAMELFGKKSTSRNGSHGLRIDVPTNDPQYRLSPVAGDIVVSIGLDWDQSYSSEFYNLQKKKGIHVITCCYDLIPVLFPQYCVGDVSSRFKEYFNSLAWGSTAVLCISEQTRKDYLDLCNRIGSPIRPSHVIPLGDNVPTGEGELGPEVQAVIRKPFILFVSTIERRKNHEVLYRAYHRLCRDGYGDALPKLVFVGMPGWGVGDLLKDIELDPLTQGKIEQLNHVTDYELMQLYNHALFCAYPSLYEGWGLPVGEALAMGKAVLSSDQGSLPEVGRDLVRYLPAWDVNAWADAILEWCMTPAKVEEIELRVKKEYRVRKWSDTANVVKDVIDGILADKSNVEMAIYPGHDCSTQIGVHIGSGLQGTGKDGFLMYGPHRSIEAGSYAVKVFGVADVEKDANLLFDFVANEGRQCLWRGDVRFPQALSVKESLVVEFNIDVERTLDDFEVRCIDRGAQAQLTRLEISRR
ncbi:MULTISPECIES: glycosyltransferase family 1 protein [Burkholderia]|uniref:glycosyltransferase family 4 protein n=1 Tax=Burkholderia TaxID=32008 RepID=UPI00191533F7|nr:MULTISPECIES: glycosyltransferase family 1 protein [Burkholderia]MDN7535544.1 glycosyltransferase family 1 protein [Burkholderia orbicola]